MNSNRETFFGVLFELLRYLRDQMGWLGWVILGLFLLACMLMAVIVLRWSLRGGFGPGATRRFFAERREIERWLKNH